MPVEEADAELVQRQAGLVDQLPDHQHDNGEYRNRAEKDNHAEHRVRNAAAAGLPGADLLQHGRSCRLPLLAHLGQRRDRSHRLLELSKRFGRIHGVDAIRHLLQERYRRLRLQTKSRNSTSG